MNQDNMAIYTNWLGNGSCRGKSDVSETTLVTREGHSNTSYNVHTHRNPTKQVNGIKVGLTRTIAAGGGLAPALVQVLGFTDKEMPPHLVSSGVIVLKVEDLSMDRALNIDSNSYGCIVLVHKGLALRR